mmetsp:Transcript_21691/g.48871  ORF Transcript_21691/g.48871 Transcript_21691/m.48871 type:complete len:123 (-) Transcript_21691:418-786(-)
MKELDIDQNGIIELREFTISVAKCLLQQEGAAELSMALALFEPGGGALADDTGTGGSSAVSVAHVRQLLMTHGTHPLSEEEGAAFTRLADPEGRGQISYEGFKGLSCWQPDWNVGKGAMKDT